ncbi:MAG TPA: RICIN domain-containing protein [Polyangiaceae bacterium]|nr:RICIN domain-containing protein [Polyangiaceae bacterium]
MRSLQVAAGVLLLAGCGLDYAPAEDFTTNDDSPATEETTGLSELGEMGVAEQGLSAACGGDDANALAAGLAVAIGNELGRWDVNTDFQIVNGKLELSATGQLRCSSGCGNVAALLRLQDDASAGITNHSPSNFRTKLTTWYAQQKTALTNLVTDMLTVDQGVFRIRSKLSGKYIVPQNGSTTSGAILEQSDQYTGTTAAQWRVMLDGTRQHFINIKSGMCMDLLSNTSSSTNIVQRPCNGVTTQNFRLGLLEAGVLTIRSDYNQAFIPQGSSTANGADIIQTTVTGQAQEKFIFEPYGSEPHRDLLEVATAVYSLKAAHTGMGLAVSSSSSSDGVSIVQQSYVATDDRFHWYITPLGKATINGVLVTTYQFMNRRTGKCIDMEGSQSPRRAVQRTCSTAETQRFSLAPTGNLRQVAYSNWGLTMDIQGGSTASGAQFGEGYSGEGWQWHNMFTFEPILAIEPHKLRFNRQEAGGPCGNYYWYDVTEPNGLVLDDPASTYVQLIFAGGKQTPSGTDLNPFISQKVSGSQVAIDPTLGTYSSGTTAAGSCTPGCLKVTTSNVAGQCCECNGAYKKYVKASWSATTYSCQ